jgi:hypothetical protein
VQRSKPEAMPSDEFRNEGTPSHSEGPNAGAQTFGSFGAFAKGTRRKGETASHPPPQNRIFTQPEPQKKAPTYTGRGSHITSQSTIKTA